MQQRQFAYTAGQYVHKKKESENPNSPLPFSFVFRLRFLLCIFLLAGLILADRYAFKKEETTAVFQYLEKDTAPREVGHCIYELFVIK